jgi:hypothetical protein
VADRKRRSSPTASSTAFSSSRMFQLVEVSRGFCESCSTTSASTDVVVIVTLSHTPPELLMNCTIWPIRVGYTKTCALIHGMTISMRNTEKNTDKSSEAFPFIVNTPRAADIANLKLAQ